MRKIPPASPTYIGPPKYHGDDNNKPPRHVVIHSTVSPCENGGARKIANYFKNPSSPSSAHYMIDPGEIIQGLYDSFVGYAAPPNEHKLHFEMCDIPGPVPGDKPGSARWKALKKAWRWNKTNQKQMLDRTAWLAARQCLAYDIPIQFCTVRMLKQGKAGITTHANVSKTWHQSTHWDPGFWPRRKFMRMVNQHAKAIRKHYSSPNERGR
jgi:hypothetical protein